MYPLINSLMSANITQFDLWQTIVNAVPHTALISWAASFTRASDWGRDWDLKVNNFLPDPIYNLPIQQSTTASLPLSLLWVKWDYLGMMKFNSSKIKLLNSPFKME